MGDSVECRLFERTKLDPPDEIEEKWRACHNAVLKLIAGASEQEAHDILSAKVCRSVQEHEEVSVGLLNIILTNPGAARTRYSDLAFVTRDGLGLVVNCLEFIVMEKFRRMREMTKQQILWIVNEMVRNRFAGVERVCIALLKQIEGGNTMPGNVRLADSVLRVFRDNREWLESLPRIVCFAVYTYLRLIQDHSSPALTSLRNAEVDFCIACLRTQFMDCAAIGRDLVRLLQTIARIPEFAALWKDILQNPTSLSPHFSGVLQLLTVRTSRHYIASRLTSDMEAKLNFLAMQVKFGHQKRYQDWFQRDYLLTPESQSLISDFIRYICCIIHPSNEILSSDVVQRWAIIGWLLTKCQSNVAACNAKLALFYDWFFYNPEHESIMCIEPAILIMSYSVNTHPNITATLIDFLVRMIPAFGEGLEEYVSHGVNNAIRDILEKRVVGSIDQLISSPRLDSVLTGSFQRAVQRALDHFQNPEPFRDGDDDVVVIEDEEVGGGGGVDSGVFPSSIDDESERMEKPVKGVELGEVEIVEEEEDAEEKEKTGEDEAEIDLGEELRRLPDRWVRKIEALKRDSLDVRRKAVDELMESVVREIDVRSSQLNALAKCMAIRLKSDFDDACEIEGEMSDVGRSLPFSLFRHADPARPSNVYRRVVAFLPRLFNHENRLGYTLLYYAKARAVATGDPVAAASVYAAFAAETKSPSASPASNLEACIIRDMERCQTVDTNLFYFLIPGVYQQFSDAVTGSSGLLYLIVSSIDSAQLHDLICQLSLSKFQLFGCARIAELLAKSLEWETFEQISVWQLLMAENSAPEEVVKILPLDSNSHPEPLSGLVLFLRNHSPSPELLEAVFRMPTSDGQFALTVLKQWAVRWPRELVTPVVDCLGRAVEEKRGDESSTGVIIQYINDLRQLLPGDNQCRMFFVYDYQHLLDYWALSLIVVCDPEMIDSLAMFDTSALHPSPSERTPPSTPKWLKSGERKRSQSLSDNELDIIPKPKLQRAARRFVDESDDDDDEDNAAT
ncbi:integrator complex subunit 3-like isoform X2 [Oscarella lobularis]|uniref:integrator complex subunit 3-like isoform X2 n=1 Tax=Oscarella lobularis TaxID=121494 RepID=UPI00331406A9